MYKHAWMHEKLKHIRVYKRMQACTCNTYTTSVHLSYKYINESKLFLIQE